MLERGRVDRFKASIRFVMVLTIREVDSRSWCMGRTTVFPVICHLDTSVHSTPLSLRRSSERQSYNGQGRMRSFPTTYISIYTSVQGTVPIPTPTITYLMKSHTLHDYNISTTTSQSATYHSTHNTNISKDRDASIHHPNPR
jgi:hypothetical protein